jgi:hypothetical protein
MGVGERFPETGENNTGQIGQLVQTFDELPESALGHLPHFILPDVPDAGSAMKVASCGRFDVKLPHIRKARKKKQVAFPSIQPIFRIRGDVSSLEKGSGQD